MATTKYDIKQKVYFITEKAVSKRTKCENCLGEGYLFNSAEEKILCCYCENGYIEDSFDKEYVKQVSEGVVGTININSKGTYYGLYCEHQQIGYSVEKDVFLTEEDAKRNLDKAKPTIYSW